MFQTRPTPTRQYERQGITGYPTDKTWILLGHAASPSLISPDMVAMENRSMGVYVNIMYPAWRNGRQRVHQFETKK
jgi:hypothetical protein